MNGKHKPTLSLLTGSADAAARELDEAWEVFLSKVSGEAAPGRWAELAAQPLAGAQPERAVPAEQAVPAQPAIAPAVELAERVGAGQPGPSTTARRRPRWAGRAVRVGAIGAAAVLGVGFLFTAPGNRVLADMFQTFTIQHIQATNPGDLASLQQMVASLHPNGKPLQLSQYGQVTVTQTSPAQTLSLAAAVAQTGLAIPALPGVASPTVHVSGGRQVTFRIHVAAVNALLTQLGGTVGFPLAADGQPIVIQTHAVAVEAAPTGSVVLAVTRMPQLQVPSSVDVNQVRQALLSLPFLPDDIRSDLASQTRWADTLLVPNAGHLQNVSVNGNEGVMNAPLHQILWLKQGVVYSLRGSQADFPTAAELLQAAEALSS